MHCWRLRGASDMYWRRLVGIVMMVIFLPVNAAFFLLVIEAFGISTGRPDWFIGLLFLILFCCGGVLAFMPKISLLKLFQRGDQP